MKCLTSIILKGFFFVVGIGYPRVVSQVVEVARLENNVLTQITSIPANAVGVPGLP